MGRADPLHDQRRVRDRRDRVLRRPRPTGASGSGGCGGRRSSSTGSSAGARSSRRPPSSTTAPGCVAAGHARSPAAVAIARPVRPRRRDAGRARPAGRHLRGVPHTIAARSWASTRSSSPSARSSAASSAGAAAELARDRRDPHRDRAGPGDRAHPARPAADRRAPHRRPGRGPGGRRLRSDGRARQRRRRRPAPMITATQRRRPPVSRVAIVTDSASDLPGVAAAHRDRRRPARSSASGPNSFRAGVDLTTEAVLGADGRSRRAVPDDGRGEPGRVQGGVRGGLRRRRRRDRLRDRRLDPVGHEQERPDRPRAARRTGRSTSSTPGAPRWARASSRSSPRSWPRPGVPADGIAADLEGRTDDALVAICLDTLEYLKKGGRISGPQAAIGGAPRGQADHLDQGRPRRHRRAGPDPVEGARAGDRVHPVRARRADRRPPHGQPGRRGVPRRARPPGARRDRPGPGLDPASSARRSGPHLGPGAVGAAVLRQRPD